eukprot:419421-Pleurochrysis_carterae.AAC.1
MKSGACERTLAAFGPAGAFSVSGARKLLRHVVFVRSEASALNCEHGGGQNRPWAAMCLTVH